MRRLFNGILAGGLVLGLAGTARAQVTSPTEAIVTIDGVHFDLSSLFVPSGNNTFSLPSQTVVDGLGDIVTVGASGIGDPVLSYSFSATNPTGGAIPFAFDAAIPLTTPVVAGTPINTSLGVTLTDGGSDGTVITPLNTALQHATGDGSDLGSSVDIGTTETGVAGGTSVFAFSGNGTAPFTFTTLDIHLGFTLSGGGDNAGITGRVSTGAVPEPGAVAMLAGLGVSGGAFALRRKRRS
jgi:hypothetical protein